MAMRFKLCALISIPFVTAILAGCSENTPPPDEAKTRWFGAKSATPAELEEAARKYYQPASEDYFEHMDGVAPDGSKSFQKLILDPEEIKGRNAWVLWAGGNEAFWDWLARHSYGAIDLLKLVDTKENGRRFSRVGLITEPGMRPPTDEETRAAFGIRYARPDPKTHVEATKQEHQRPNPDYYGYPSGVVGLRVFPNPEFTGAAKTAWERAHETDSEYFYNNDEYASRPDTIRPFRVGMSCGFCHIAHHPLRPPVDPEFPQWENLSNNIGNQYLRFRAIFANNLKPNNYLYHVLDAQLPGTIDTSLVASDNINNANTINPFFGLRPRITRAENNPKETIGPSTFAYLRDFVDKEFENPHYVPRVLLDGSDSVGVNLALARVYVNIGTYHQEWIRTHNPLLGFRRQKPFSLKNTVENSVYWHATRIRVDPMFAFFKKSTDPMLLRNAPLTDDQRKTHLKGDGKAWHEEYKDGRKVFAKGCIACHSSIQPGDRPDLELLIKGDKLPALDSKPAGWEMLSDADKKKFVASRQALRLRVDDLVRLTRGDGMLPAAYAQWAQVAVDVIVDEDGKKIGLLWKDNYLSTDVRIPVTLTRTNSARAMATNALHGNVWEDYASQTYKELDSVGRITYKDPFSGSEKSYQAPSGGPGYYRVPPLISIWATAPFLHNNALGKFNNDPSVKGRLEAFDDGITKLLWPQKRREPTKNLMWVVDQPKPADVDNASAARLEADGGWVWRTTEESWFTFYGHDIPIHVAGLTGWSPFLVKLLPWVPSLVLLALTLVFLLNRQRILFWEKLRERKPALEWLVSPLKWLAVVGALAFTILCFYLLARHSLTLQLLDLATMRSIPWLRVQVFVLPLVLFGSIVVLVFPERYWSGRSRMIAAKVMAIACLVLAIVMAVGFGRFFSGNGSGIKLGPIPKGVPVNLIANMDPNVDFLKKKAALDALANFVTDFANAPQDRKPGLKEFEQRVAPAFMAASKCPDFIMDRGHDYEFLRAFSDDEKKTLIALLKTF
jgi:hypothetical protein